MKKRLADFLHRRIRIPLRLAAAFFLRMLPLSSRHGGLPRGVIWDSAEWVREKDAHGPCSERGRDYWQIKVRDAEVVAGKIPRTIEPALHPAFSPYRFYRFPELTLTHIRNGRVALSEGVVISPDDRVFEQFTHQWGAPISENKVFKVPGLPRPEYHEGSWVTLVVPASTRNVGHWLFDGLLRLSILEEAGLATGVNLILPSLNPRFTEIAEALGYDSSRWGGLNEGHWEVEHLLVPSYVSVSGVLRPWACRWLRSRLGVEDQPVGTRRIWVSRQHAKWRRLLNEEDLWPLLRKEGFEIVELERLSFREQVDLFAQAQVVAGPHGAGMTDLLFAPRGIRVLEIFPPRFVNPVFYSMTNALDQEYNYFIGSTPVEARHPEGSVDLDHFLAPIAQLQRALKGLNLDR